MGGRRRDSRDLLDELEERDDSEYEEIVTWTFRKCPRYTTPEPDPLNDEEITTDSILKFKKKREVEWMKCVKRRSVWN
jgi:hypothetical protein